MPPKVVRLIMREGETFNGQLIRDIQRLETEMAPKTGETMVVGGLMSEETLRIESGVPILGSIPVLKWTFVKENRRAASRDLVFFLTPEVVFGEAEKAEILERSEQRLLELDPFKPWAYLE